MLTMNHVKPGLRSRTGVGRILSLTINKRARIRVSVMCQPEL